MNQLERHRDLLVTAQAEIPRCSESDPVFQTPWQARVFALVIASVRNGHFSWSSFQGRLVEALKDQSSLCEPQGTDEIERHYFNCWLRATEQTLVEEGFVVSDDVAGQIAAIRQSVEEIRSHQLSHR